MTYKIEKNVPMPLAVARGKYPWNSMEAGDSILVPHRNANGARQAAYVWIKNNRPGLGIKTQMEDDGTRIWFKKKGE
jgi:hypothetical protein